MANYRLLQGDCLEVLKTLPENSVQCVVTSPPYYGLRDYGVDGQIGLEQSPEEYVAKLVDVFREVRRVLRDDGVVFLNLGDSYWGSNKGYMADGTQVGGEKQMTNKGSVTISGGQRARPYGTSCKEPVNSQGHDCLCENLCDACRRAYLIGKFHNGNPHAPKLSALPCETNRECMEFERDHLPTSDLDHQVSRNGNAILDFENSQDHASEPLHVSRVSRLDESSPQFQDNNSEVSNQGVVCLLCGCSFSRSIQGCAHKLGDSELQSSHNQDISLHDDQRLFHNQCKGRACECYRGNGSYQYCTTEFHYKPKDLLGIPWRVAFALQADGWWLRSDIIWHKPNPMPESVRDRPTKAHEYIFLLTKSAKYYYDNEAVREEKLPG